jgi:WD40 repeat protein
MRFSGNVLGPFSRPRLVCVFLALLLAAPACRPRPRPPDASLHIHDLATGEKVNTLRASAGATLAIALSPDARLTLTADGSRDLRLWSIETGQEIAAFDPFQAPPYRGAAPWKLGPIVHLQFLHGTNLLLVAHESAGVSLWDLQLQMLVTRFVPPFVWTSSAVVVGGNPDRVIATAYGQPTAIWWDLTNSQHRGIFTELRKTGSPWVTLARDGKPRSWWNADTGEPWTAATAEPEGPLEHAPRQVRLSPDGRTLLSYYGSVYHQPNISGIELWDLETGRLRWTKRNFTLPIIMACRSSSSCETIAFSPDSTWLALGTVGDRIAIHDAEDGRLDLDLHAPRGSCIRLAFLPDGRRLLTWGDSTMRLWDLDRGEHVRSFSVPRLCSFTVTPDERLLLVGGAGGNQGK